MNYKKPLGLLAALVGVAVYPCQAQTFNQAVRMMLDNEPELLAVNADSRATYESWNAARAGLKPQISANASTGGIERTRTTDGLTGTSSTTGLFSRDIGVSLRQLVFDGGTTKNSSESTFNNYEAARYLQMGMIEDRIVDLAEVYLELFRTDEQMKLAQQNVADHKRMLENLRIREAGGEVRTQTQLIQGRLSKAMNRADMQEIKREEAIARFERLIGKRPDFNCLSLPVANFNGGKCCEANWEFLASQSALAAAIHQARAQAGLRVPQVYLDLGASRGENNIGVAGSDNELSAMFTMSWDLSTGGANRANQRYYKHKVENAAELVRAAQKDCMYNQSLLATELDSANRSVNSFANYSNRMSKVIGDYEEQFDIGMQSLIDLLDVRNEYFEARTQEIDSRYTVISSKVRTLGEQGRFASSVIGDYAKQKLALCDDRSDSWASRKAFLTPEEVDEFTAPKCPAPCDEPAPANCAEKVADLVATPVVMQPASVQAVPVAAKSQAGLNNLGRKLFGRSR